jgi:hypothetical protein
VVRVDGEFTDADALVAGLAWRVLFQARNEGGEFWHIRAEAVPVWRDVVLTEWPVVTSLRFVRLPLAGAASELVEQDREQVRTALAALVRAQLAAGLATRATAQLAGPEGQEAQRQYWELATWFAELRQALTGPAEEKGEGV